MTSFLALMKREFIEHRGALVIAPAVLLAIFVVFIVAAFVFGRIEGLIEELVAEFELTPTERVTAEVTALAGLSFYASWIIERSYMVVAGLWWVYLLGVTLFYCADAFAADQKNNAMLFWKSMPVSDGKIIASKLATATLTAPLMVWLFSLLQALFLSIIVGLAVRNFISVDLVLTQWIPSFLGIAAGVGVILAITVLWYLPAIAWVGALSAVAGRWSIPLALLIPGIVGLVEHLVLRIQTDGGHVWRYLSWRLPPPNVEDGYLGAWFGSQTRFDLGAFTADMVGNLDWTQVGIGALFALVVLYLASEYRRRNLA